jgi:hypothetical protein
VEGMIRVAINGFGRIGRNTLRAALGHSKYGKNLTYGRTIKLTPEEIKYSLDILHDQQAKEIIDKKRSSIIKVLDKYLANNPDVKGISINSFDNTILLNYGIEKDSLEKILILYGSWYFKKSPNMKFCISLL